MVICFLCKTVVENLKALRVHFQFFHYQHTFERYRCIEVGCSRSYHLFNSFRRHYLKEHTKATSNSDMYNKDFAEGEGTCEVVPLDHRPISSAEKCVMHTDTLPAVAPEKACNSLSLVSLEKALASMIALLYGSANLPRNIVQIIIDNILNILLHTVVPLIHRLLNNMSDNNEIHFTNSILDVVQTIHNAISLALRKFSTEHRRLHFFKRCQTYIPSQTIVVGESRSSKTIYGRPVISSVNHTMQFIPLRKVLQAFFSLDTLLVDTLQYMEDLSKDKTKIQNFVQGSYWQSRRQVHCDKRVVPLFLFFDDFETSNALGSHSGIHKLGALYVSVPCLPPWRCSSLSSIFLTLLLHSSDRSQFGNTVIFQPVIEELNHLRTFGITFDIPNFSGVVYFELALIIGDNLGIHSIIGFVESFSGNYPCRICRIKNNDMKIKSCADETLLRSSADYEADLLEGNPASSGVKERCVWLKVRDFDLFKQVGVDVMHDILEGVGKYVMGLILIKFICRFKYFSLETLNDRIRNFAYGPDSRNKPVELSMHHINQRNIRLSASEMLTFIRYFSLIVGDKVPDGDSYWVLYLKLKEVVELVSASYVWEGLAAVLQDNVIELNNMYLLLSNSTLKPKFHHLTHYHNAMINFGPLSLFSSIRYEAKHRIAKTSARASCNRRNITSSLAMKHQLKLNQIFSTGALDPILSWGPKKLESTVSDLKLIQSCLYVDSRKSLLRVPWISMSTVRYSKGSVLVYSPVIMCDRNELTFIMVENVYVYQDNKVLFTGTLLESILFDYHYHSYEVELKEEKKAAIWLSALQFQTPHTLNTISFPTKKYMVTLRSPV